MLRGAAFVFRNYATDAPAVTALWTVVFGIASLLTPFFLGAAAAGLATGRFAWAEPFALSGGLFAVVVCAQIAAVFILREIEPGPLQDDFRRRAVRATLAVWAVGIVPALFALREPIMLSALERPVALAAVVGALLAGLATIVCVLRRWDWPARVAVGAEATAILAGWFGAQAPDLIPGRYTYVMAASSDAMIDAFLTATGIGLVVLVPSMLLLFRVFKRAPIPD